MRTVLNLCALGSWVLVFGFVAGASAATLPSAPRIVTLSPALAEWTAEILGRDRVLKTLVGVSEYSDYPPDLKTMTKVGPYPQLNVEKIASLKPTLVVASRESNRIEQIEKLRRLKLHVEVLPAEKFEAMEAWIKKLGDVLGSPSGGAAAAKKWADGIHELKKSLARRKRVERRVLIQIQENPLIVVGGDGFLNPALEMIGYRNVFRSLKQSYPKVSKEAVLKADPEVILVMDMSGAPDDFERITGEWKRFSDLSAVKADKIRKISADDYGRCSLRLLNALKQLSSR